jgi:DNA repair exonuclease SbcCD ATPase subunit
MLFSIGNLITLVIVLVFFILYHRLTANNRSLEKVKKLAERLQGELGSYVEAKSEELKHYGIDLDVQQKAARIALEKLQAAQSIIDEKSTAIGDIAERFKEYDAVLAKLMNMTARVDENLARIHDDEAFAESINRKLELSKKALAALERELPLLRDNFEQSAQRTVESFKEEILDELQEGLANTAAELKAVKAEAMDAFDKALSARELVEAELNKALETASMRAADIEDSAFKTLTKDVEVRLEACRSDVENKITDLAQNASSVTGELKSAISEFKERWANEAESMLSDMIAKLEEADSIFAAKTEAIAALIESAFKNAKASEETISASVERSKKDVDDTLAVVQSIGTTLDRSLEATKTRIEDEFAAFGQTFEDHRLRFEDNFMAEISSLNEAIRLLHEQIAELKESAYDKAKNTLEGFEDELVASLTAKRADAFRRMDGWLSDMEKTLSGIAAEAKARRQVEEAEHLKEFKAHLIKVRDASYSQVDKAVRDLDSLKESIESQVKSLQESLESMKPAPNADQAEPNP